MASTCDFHEKSEFKLIPSNFTELFIANNKVSYAGFSTPVLLLNLGPIFPPQIKLTLISNYVITD